VLNIYVLDAARPSGPQWPDRNSYMTRGLLMGLLAGIGLSLLLERLNQRIRSVEELRAMIPLPLLGLVPEINGKVSLSVRGKWIDEHLFSPIAEAFRTLRTSIYFGLPKDQSKVILITSPLMGEGKSMVASNLGIAMAQSGHRTLIVDSDFRRPMQDQIFEVSKEIGLSTLVAARCKFEEAIVASGIAGLDILPIGPNPHNPTEILNSKAFAQIILSLRQQYDNVIIDSPPVLPVADARILTGLSDITLLILRVGVSSNKPALAAIAALSSVGGRVLGAVANAVDGRKRKGYEYGYGYGNEDNSSQPTNGHNGTNGNDQGKSPLLPKAGGRPMISEVTQELKSDSEVPH
jgi:succinoglycan biosynthesis transport protein ExoP